MILKILNLSEKPKKIYNLFSKIKTKINKTHKISNINNNKIKINKITNLSLLLKISMDLRFSLFNKTECKTESEPLLSESREEIKYSQF